MTGKEVYEVWASRKSGELDSVFDFMANLVKQAILAEREACAKICDERDEEMEGLQCYPLSYQEGFRWGCKEIKDQICARSNAPESPNKAAESPGNPKGYRNYLELPDICT